MAEYLFFDLLDPTQLESALSELVALGLKEPAILEDSEEGISIGGVVEGKIVPQLSRQKAVPPIDWHAQWGVESGALLEYDLSEYGPYLPLNLTPGAGFGDLSHPTTQLTLKLLSAHAERAQFIDIGCGSGVLSLAALLMGAQKAFALDICPLARIHTFENAKLNGLEERVVIAETLQEAPEGVLLIAMNMIGSEQRVAWASSPSLHRSEGHLITSGILAEEEADYLLFATSQGWELVRSLEREGWMAFLFSRKAID